MTNKYAYSEAEQDAIYKVIAERRDMRHFLPSPVEAQTLQKILQAAHHAPRAKCRLNAALAIYSY